LPNRERDYGSAEDVVAAEGGAKKRLREINVIRSTASSPMTYYCNQGKLLE
jgi:hypothetical protein